MRPLSRLLACRMLLRLIFVGNRVVYSACVVKNYHMKNIEIGIIWFSDC